MTKKRFSKLLSVILALAICATTVFGCLITANAATPCYAWSDGKVADDGQTATINLTITAPDLLADYGFQSGSFTLTQDTALNIDGVEAASGTQKNGSTDVSDIEVTPDENGSYLFDSNSFYSEVVFKITYKASFEKGKEYEVNVTSMKLANSWDEYPENASGKAGVIEWGCDHVVSVVGLTPVATGNGYSVYENAVCAKCGENIGYQLVPTESLTKPDVVYLAADYDTPESVTFAGSGTEAEPYIIDTVGKLRSLVQAKTDITQNTAGKFFKIADDIDIICLQRQSYMDANGGLDAFMAKSADEVKTFFESNTSGRTNWNSASGSFAGTIDFNGVTIVGAYAVNGGLFENVRVGATIKNLNLTHNYFTHGDKTGSVVGYVPNPGAENVGTVTFDTIIIHNNALVSTNTSAALERTGVLMAFAYDNVAVKYSNLLTYGNKATGGNIGEDFALIGFLSTGWNGLGSANPNGDYNTSVILDCVPYPISAVNNQGTRKEYWHSIYTNGNIDAYKANSWAENSALGITKISADEVKGDNAKTLMDKLGWGYDGNGAWYTGNAWGYPSFEKASVMPEAYQSAYDNLALDSYITYGDSTAQFGLYAGAVNLMTNPSIGFTFAFADNYKANRDKINIKITNADGTVTYYRGNPPAYDGSEIVNQNGWTNKTKAGRYHLLKLDGSVGTVVAAKDLCNDVKITMEYNGKTVNATFNLKGLAKEYEDAYKLTGSNYYLVRAEAIKAVIYYAQMLEARYS